MPEGCVTVIAGGWSAGTVANPPVGQGFVIGVNDAGLYARCDAVLSMDRLWTENRWDWLKTRSAETHIRRSAAKNIDRPDWLEVFDNDHESTVFSDTPGTLNGTNSGFCALNLSYQMRPALLVLVGFDMGKGPAGEAHWYPDYPWAKPGGGTSSGKFAAWARQFDDAAEKFRWAGIAVEVRGATAIPAFRSAV